MTDTAAPDRYAQPGEDGYRPPEFWALLDLVTSLRPPRLRRPVLPLAPRTPKKLKKKRAR